MDVSVLGFGAAEIGFAGVDPAIVSRLVEGALDAGLNVIDTAECYADSEELLGKAVSHRREDYWLFSKCGHPEGYTSEDWRPASLLSSIERSVRRLRTDRLDLIQLHSCSEDELRKGDVIDALRTARDRGLARFLGYSGDSDAARYAIECGAFDVLQTSVSLADQEAIERVLPLAVAKDVGVIAKRPIANAAWMTGKKPASEYHHSYWARLEKLHYDFLKPGSPESVAIALRFTLSQPGVHTAIVGTTKPERWAENAATVAKGPLPPRQVAEIRARWRSAAPAEWTGET